MKGRASCPPRTAAAPQSRGRGGLWDLGQWPRGSGQSSLWVGPVHQQCVSPDPTPPPALPPAPRGHRPRLTEDGAESPHHGVASVPSTPSSSPSGAALGGVSFRETPSCPAQSLQRQRPPPARLSSQPRGKLGRLPLPQPSSHQGPLGQAPSPSPSPLGLHPTGPWGPRLPAPDPTQLGQFHRPVLGRLGTPL